MSDHIILISCSNGKMRGGDAAYNPDHSIAAVLPSHVRKELCSRRCAVASLILEGRVEDRLRGDGNRRDSRYNTGLAVGPDLGGGLCEECSVGVPSGPSVQYLPAYRRYDGRFFAHAGEDAFEKAIVEECHVLIVSGLYGLLLPEEPIQAYNCHLDDETMGDGGDATGDAHGRDGEQMGARISETWRRDGLPTRLLQAFIQWHDDHHDHTIAHVVDLLSETSYQRIFDWEELHGVFKARRIAWYHRMVQGVREPAFLADLGRYFRRDLVEDGFHAPPQGKVSRDYFQTIPQKGGNLQFIKEVRPDPFTENHVRKELGTFTWNRLDRLTRDDLIHGEVFFQLYDAQSSKDPEEMAPRIVNYFSALENELHCICGIETEGIGMGAYVRHLCGGTITEIWSDNDRCASVCKKLKRLLSIRNRMSHRGVVKRRELLDVRNALLQENGLLADLVALKPAMMERRQHGNEPQKQ